MLLQGKYAVVTGASRGIGRQIALMLAEHGADVAVLARNRASLDETAAEVEKLGRRALPIACDITDLSQIPQVLAQIQKEFPRIDVWVNNAGIAKDLPPEDISEEEWDRMVDTDLRAPFFWTQAVYRIMQKQGGGRFVHIASIAGQKGARNNGVHYVAAKGGIIALSKGLALTGARYGIQSNVICPGLIDTDMAKELNITTDQAYIDMVPLHRLGTGRDIAGAVVYLASSLADYVTGATIDVNGGLYLR